MNTLLHHTFQDQKQLNLTWYGTWSTIIRTSTFAKPHLPPTFAVIREHIRKTFVNHWKKDLHNQPIMSFYIAVKSEIGEEQYYKKKIPYNRFHDNRFLIQ